MVLVDFNVLVDKKDLLLMIKVFLQYTCTCAFVAIFCYFVSQCLELIFLELKKEQALLNIIA